MKYCKKCLNMSGLLSEMLPLQISVWSAGVRGHLWGIIISVAMCILGGFLQSMIGKRLPLHLENNIMLCIAWDAKRNTKICLDTCDALRLPKFLWRPRWCISPWLLITLMWKSNGAHIQSCLMAGLRMNIGEWQWWIYYIGKRDNTVNTYMHTSPLFHLRFARVVV